VTFPGPGQAQLPDATPATSSATAQATTSPGDALPSDRATYSQIFRIGEFAAVIVAHVISMLGTIVAEVALTVLVYQRTHSSVLAALTLSLVFLPYVVGGSILSSAAARWRTRRTLVLCDVVSAVIVGVMALPSLPVAPIFVLLFMLGLLAPVFQGVRAATLPQILPPGAPYVLGRSVLRLISQGAQVCGFAVGGLLLVAVSPRIALVVDAVSFLVSAAILRIGTRERRPPESMSQQSFMRESLGSVAAVMKLPRLRKVMFIEWFLPTCAVAPEALAAPYVSHLHLGSNMVGFWLTAIPAGTVVGDVVAARLLPTVWQRRIAIPSMALTAAALLLFVVRPGFSVAFAFLVAVGVGASYQPAVDQELIDASPAQLQAAALSINTAGLMFFQGIGFTVWGAIGEALTPSAVVTVAGVVALVVVVFFHPWSVRHTR
jgi:predicted MFS family arabinose efflux permease